MFGGGGGRRGGARRGGGRDAAEGSSSGLGRGGGTWGGRGREWGGARCGCPSAERAMTMPPQRRMMAEIIEFTESCRKLLAKRPEKVAPTIPTSSEVVLRLPQSRLGNRGPAQMRPLLADFGHFVFHSWPTSGQFRPLCANSGQALTLDEGQIEFGQAWAKFGQHAWEPK